MSSALWQISGIQRLVVSCMLNSRVRDDMRLFFCHACYYLHCTQLQVQRSTIEFLKLDPSIKQINGGLEAVGCTYRRQWRGRRNTFIHDDADTDLWWFTTIQPNSEICLSVWDHNRLVVSFLTCFLAHAFACSWIPLRRVATCGAPYL